MAERSEPTWFARSAELCRQSAELRAVSDDILRRARERRQAATKVVRELREMFGLPHERRDRLVHQ